MRNVRLELKTRLSIKNSKYTFHLVNYNTVMHRAGFYSVNEVRVCPNNSVSHSILIDYFFFFFFQFLVK